MGKPRRILKPIYGHPSLPDPPPGLQGQPVDEAELERVYQAAWKLLRDIRGVFGIDRGLRMLDAPYGGEGPRTQDIVVRIHVDPSYDERFLPKDEIHKILGTAPESINFICPDRAAAGPTPLLRSSCELPEIGPIRPGLSIANAVRLTQGTLGAIVVDQRQERLALLSAWHVLAAECLARHGEAIHLQDRATRQAVAELVLDGRLPWPGPDGDAALAWLSDVALEQIRSGERELRLEPNGTQDLLLEPDQEIGLEHLWRRFRKVGIFTCLTEGCIDGIGRYRLRNFDPFLAADPWIAGFRAVQVPGDPPGLGHQGDSGSVLYLPGEDESAGEAVGLFFDSTRRRGVEEEYILAGHLPRALRALDARLATPEDLERIFTT